MEGGPSSSDKTVPIETPAAEVSPKEKTPGTILTKTSRLKLEEITSILSDGETKYQVIHSAPFRPQPGEIFLFSSAGNPENNEKWRSDQYHWYQNGTKSMPDKDPVIKKIYFAYVAPSGRTCTFHKHVYRMLKSNRHLVLLHYLGDPSVIDETGRTRLRTKRGRGKTEEPPPENKKPVVTEPKKFHELLEECRTFDNVVNELFCVSLKDFVALQVAAQERKDFVKKIVIYPCCSLICGKNVMLEEVERLLQFTSSQPQLLMYDTAFTVGDFKIAALLFKHTLFQGGPALPAFFLIHNSDSMQPHEEFAQVVSEALLASFGKGNLPIVFSNQEHCRLLKGFVNTQQLQPWTDTMQRAKAWLEGNGYSTQEVSIYLAHIRGLFSQRTEADYKNMLEKCKLEWKQTFTVFFAENIQPFISKCFGRWIYEEHRVYNPYCGVSLVYCEPFCNLMKGMASLGKVPLDCIIDALDCLQVYFLHQIQEGLNKNGNYHLLPEFEGMVVPTQSIAQPVLSPENIVNRVQSNMQQQFAVNSQHQSTSSSTNEAIATYSWITQ